MRQAASAQQICASCLYWRGCCAAAVAVRYSAVQKQELCTYIVQSGSRGAAFVSLDRGVVGTEPVLVAGETFSLLDFSP